jgi:aminobenzoyl-glutamate utilization protein B
MRRYTCAALILSIALTAVGHAQPAARDDRDALVQGIEAKRATYADVANQIWGFAEVGYQEQKSSALLQAQLKAAGFDVKAGVAEIPTAFTATYGSGKPLIGIVGEFDALPSLSQDMSSARKPLVADAPVTAAGTTCSARARSPRRLR